MAEALLTFAVEGILGKAVALAAEEISLAWGFRDALKQLEISMRMIQAVLRQAEGRQENDDSPLGLWLQKLKEVAYAAEDVLDEFTYEMLRRKVEIRFANQVTNYISFSNPLVFSLIMAHKIKNVNESLEKIKSEASGLGLRVGDVAGSAEMVTPFMTTLNRETDSFLDSSEVVGRKHEVSKIVSLLVGASSRQDISVITIVGMAGLGKTTLAKMVCKEAEKQKLFDVNLWVCVSDIFNDRKILGGILQSINENAGGLSNIDAIIKHLHAKLRTKRFLLMLDDVWNEESDKWESLRRRLRMISESSGNCVVVTTRKEQVASVMETSLMHRHDPKKLSNNECWSIIKEQAFGDADACIPHNLAVIGKEIADKCGGLPLVSKVLGGTMRFKIEEDAWLSIKNSRLWDSVGENNEIMPILKLSFDHLPTAFLKRCFAYCAVFPKDFLMKKEQLIQLWMAQGFLQEVIAKDIHMEDVGDEYFSILLANSLFQDVERNELRDIVSCKMHDAVHDLVQFVSRSETWIHGDDSSKYISHVQHLNVIDDKEILVKLGQDGVKNLRTLFSEIDVIEKLSWTFRRLRVLNLSDAYIRTLPASVGKLKHLRYLNLSETPVSVLPRSITKLYNLQTLILLQCYFLQQLPNGVENLISLRQFYFDSPNLMPALIGKLTSLRALTMFVVDKEEGRGIEELGTLRYLRGRLKILNLEYVTGKDEAMKANLKEKTKLYELEYNWGYGNENCRNDEGVLEGLQPCQNLKRLNILGFKGQKFPAWCSDLSVLNHLVSLRLESCHSCRELPMLGQLPHLKFLEISGMDGIKCIGDEFYGNLDGARSTSGESKALAVFPSLIKLELEEMEGLQEWKLPAVTCGGQGGVLFPHLVELTVEYCPQLSSIPLNQLTSLQKLHIADCDKLSKVLIVPSALTSDDDCDGFSDSRDISFSLPQLESMRIWRCPNLKRIPNIHGLTSLEIFDIRMCGLTHLPSWLWSCKSLQNFILCNCPDLAYFPEDLGGSITGLSKLWIGGFSKELEEFPNFSFIQYSRDSLENLRLVGWDKLKSLPHQLQYLTSLKKLEIWNFHGVEALPEWLQNLSSLHALYIKDCKILKYLPPEEAMYCLINLQKLEILECPLLEERCTKHGPEWSKISHLSMS